MPKSIEQRIVAGESVASIAQSLGVTPSAIYLRLRRAGASKRKLTAAEPRRGVKYVTIDLLGEGYRVGSDRSIQSCVSPRTGALTDDWRELAIQRASRPNCLCVSIGNSNGPRRRRIGVKKIYVEAFGSQAGEALFRSMLTRV